MPNQKKGRPLLWAAVAISATIFIIDLFTPLGVSVGMAYVAVVLLGLWASERTFIFTAAATVSFLILLKYFLYTADAELWKALTNRILSVIIIWCTAAVCDLFKKEREKNREDTALIQSVLNDSYDAVISIYANGAIVTWNAAAEHLFGWSEREAIGSRVSDLIIPPDLRERHIKALSRHTNGHELQIRQIEITGLHKSGARIPIEMNISSCLIDQKERIFTATIRDMSRLQTITNSFGETENELYQIIRKIKARKKAMEVANTQLVNFSKQISANMLELENAYLHTLNCLSLAVERKDEETAAHIARIGKYSAALARALNLPEEDIKQIALAAPMHDIGKIGIPPEILCKPGKLTAAEFAIMQKHAALGAEILGEHNAPLFMMARDIALTHHEKWNGQGYPRGIAGSAIPLCGRIVAVADCFDALTNKRPYKEPYSFDFAIEIIQKEAGQSFDPALIEVFLSQRAQFQEVFDTHKDDAPNPRAHLFALSERDLNPYKAGA